MKGLRRILIFGVSIALAVLLVAMGVILSAPFWIDSNAVKREIASLAFRATGDVVQLDRIQIRLFPPLSVEIARPRYTAAGSMEVAAENAVIDLDFPAMISGRIQPRGIRVNGLQATIHLPPASGDQKPMSLATADLQLREAMKQVARVVPALRVAVDAAVVMFHIPGQPPFALHVRLFRGQTSGGGVAGELSCASEAWDWLSLKFSLDGNELSGSGLAEFTGLNVERLRAQFGGAADWPVAEAEIIGRVEWQMKGLANVHAKAIASSSRILLQRNNLGQSLEGVVAAAELETRGSMLGLHLSRLYVAAPHMLVSANLIREGSGQVQFDMQASGVDLPALQAAARNLAPDVPWISNPPVSLTQGTLNALELRSTAKELSQLFDPALLAGEAAFEGVSLDVARPVLRFSATAGRVTLDRGELRGNNIAATLGKSVLRNGKIAMNLLSRPVTLEAGAVVALDLAETLALARKVISGKDVRRYLDAVEKLEGNALAHVTLSGNLPSLNTSIDASEIAFSLRHRNLPLPVSLSRGRILYTGDALSLSGATGEIGRSGFSDLDASMKLKPPYRFNLAQLTALLSIDELFPIAASRPELQAALAELQTVAGEITVTNAQADGSLQDLQAVNFSVGASPRNMNVQARRFPPQISLDGGLVDISNRRIDVKDVAMATLDSKLHVSGHSEDYRAGNAAIDALLQGRLGRKTLDWVYQTFELPRAYQVNAPLRFTDVAIGRKSIGEVAFKGKVNIADTTDLTIDARKTSNSFRLVRATLKDASSDVSFGGDLAGKVVKGWLKGKLAGETLRHMLVAPAVSIGSLDGDLTMDIDLDKPEEMQAKGRLEATAIAVTADQEIPVSVERLPLTADGKKITLGETVVISGENRAVLSGSIHREDKRFVVDADVRADRIVLPESLTNSKNTKSGDEDTGGKTTFKLEELPVAGRLGVNIQSLETQSLKLSPLVAEARVSGAELDLRISQAALCGITLSGGVVGEMDDLRLTGALSARDAAFADSIGCLTGDRVQGSGRMDVNANFIARGTPGQFRENIGGGFSLTARDGNLEKFDTLNRVFGVLNVTEIARGKQLALSEKGMRYRVVNAKGTLQGKVIHFDEFTLDAPTVYLAATGQVDYGNGKMAMDVMVAPLQTANAVIDKIPLLNRIFGGVVLALPVQIAGTVQHPIVVPLGPGAVATRMKNIIANTFKLPFDAIKVFSPNADKAPDAEKK